MFTLSLSFSKKELDGWGFVYRMGEETWPKICSSRQEDRFDCRQLPCPPKVDGLKAIELIFLPPNTTSKTQPMDQGVIRSLKAFHGNWIIKRYITSIDGGRSPTKVNMLEAMALLTAAWEYVSPITLINCFRKAGISSESQARSQPDVDDLFKLLEA